MDIEELKQIAIDTIETERDAIFNLSRFINEHPETAYKEKESSAAIMTYLGSKSFVINSPVGGLDTAFTADYGRPLNDGVFPVAFAAEYDALEGIGHGCGHNLIAAAAAAAAVGAAAAIDSEGKGSLCVIGTPAEEILTEAEGKIRLIKAGVFERAASCLIFHPWKESGVALKDLGCRAYKITFTGHSAHAAADPWNGKNALDAAVAFYNSISMYRQQLPSGARLHCIITSGGRVVNVIPQRASLEVMIRSTELDNLEEMEERLKTCAAAAAAASGCQSDFIYTAAVKPILFDRKLFDLAAGNMTLIGEELSRLPVWEASSDFGDVSREIPSMCLLYKTHKAEIPWHSEEVARDSHEDIANEAMLRAAKILAATAIDLIFRDKE